jgi:hypothetical protein
MAGNCRAASLATTVRCGCPWSGSFVLESIRRLVTAHVSAPRQPPANQPAGRGATTGDPPVGRLGCSCRDEVATVSSAVIAETANSVIEKMPVVLG